VMLRRRVIPEPRPAREGARGPRKVPPTQSDRGIPGQPGGGNGEPPEMSTPRKAPGDAERPRPPVGPGA